MYDIIVSLHFQPNRSLSSLFPSLIYTFCGRKYIAYITAFVLLLKPNVPQLRSRMQDELYLRRPSHEVVAYEEHLNAARGRRLPLMHADLCPEEVLR